MHAVDLADTLSDQATSSHGLASDFSTGESALILRMDSLFVLLINPVNFLRNRNQGAALISEGPSSITPETQPIETCDHNILLVDNKDLCVGVAELLDPKVVHRLR